MKIMKPSTLNSGHCANINIIFTLGLISIFIFVIMARNRRRASKEIPPGPYQWPVIGNLIQLRRNPHIKLSIMAQTYGPIMAVRLGARLLVVGSSAKAAEEILKNHDSVLSARYLSYSHPASSQKLNKYAVGFAIDCNDQWKNLRSICRAGLFAARAVQNQAKIREKNVANMVKYLHARKGQVVDMSHLIFNVVLNTMCNILLSMDAFEFGNDEKGTRGAEMKELVTKFVNLLTNPNMADLFPMLHGFDVQGKLKKAKRIYGNIFAIWKQVLEERREKRNSFQQDFLDALLDKGFNDEHINHLLLELLLAGTDTTSTIITWALADLIKNKKSMCKLRVELQCKIGDKKLEESDIVDLPYLQACIKETMRMHPPIPFLLPHRATETCKVMNHTIPKNTQVILNTWAMYHDPSVWEDPSIFNPERFLTSGLDFKGSDFEYIPFGSGRRMCPGIPMAACEVPYVVATLVNSFSWFLPGYKDSDELEMEEVYALALRKKHPLELIPRVNEKWIEIKKVEE